jgi:site-specific DNA-methyltransferase (adenine-specific)
MTPYYDHDGITLYHARCEDVLPTLPAGGIGLVFTSPPYNLGNTTGGGFPPLGHYRATDGFGVKRGGGGKWKAASRDNGLKDGYGLHDDHMEHGAYVAWQKDVLLACWRLLSETGAIFYNHKPRVLGGQLVMPLEYNPGLPLRQIVIWARAGGINFSSAFYCPTHEWIMVFAKDGFRLRDKGASGVGDVWRVAQEVNPSHPAPFPLALPKTAMETTSAGLVLDPFAGIGTTLRAAKDLGRAAIGIEVEERFCESAARRLEQGVLCFDESKG